MAAAFEGSTWLVHPGPLRKVSNAKTGSISCWVKFTDQDAANQIILDHFETGGSTRFRFYRASSNYIYILGQPPGGGSTSLSLKSATAYTSSSGYIHIAASWDLANGLGNFYVNGDDDLDTSTLTDTLLDYTSAGPWSVGVTDPDANQLSPLYADLQDLVFWPGTYLDLTDAAVMRLLLSPDGETDSDYTPTASYGNPGPTAGTRKPVGYGVQGEIPTNGVPASILLSGAMAKNAGTGGVFSQVGVIDQNDDMQTYRQSSTKQVPGQRSFDSEISGFTFPREQTFIERRDGLTTKGLRLGMSEMDDKTRDEWPERRFDQIVFPDREEDTEERDR